MPGPSQTDLLALARTPDGLAVIGVEAKVEETFDKLIGDQSRLTEGQRERLRRLADLLGVGSEALPPLRYQLFHRISATLFEADRYGAAKALLLVHSFSTRMTGHADFTAFLGAVGFKELPTTGKIVGPVRIAGIDLFAGWVADLPPRTARPPV